MIDTATDEELMIMVQRREQSALRWLYDRYYEKLRRLFFRLSGGDSDLARDCVQEVFLIVWNRASSYQLPGDFSAWCFTIAYNYWKERGRSEVRRLRRDESLPLESSGGTTQFDWEELMAGLNQQQRELLWLRFGEELPIESIARIQQCPPGTIKSRMNKAMGLLKARWNHKAQ